MLHKQKGHPIGWPFCLWRIRGPRSSDQIHCQWQWRGERAECQPGGLSAESGSASNLLARKEERSPPQGLRTTIELTNKKSSYLQEKDRRKDKYSKQTTAQGWPVNWASSTVIPPHQGHCGYAVPSASLTRRAASTTGQSRGCMATHVNQNCRIQSLVGPKVLVL